MMALPRIYSTTQDQRRQITGAELDALWAEYRAFWRGCEGGNRATGHLHGTDIAMNGRGPECST